MSPLTIRQKQMLDFIRDYTKRKGYAPSLEEIRQHFRFASVSTAHFHVSRLAQDGLIDRQKHNHRSIDVRRNESMVYIPLLGTIAAGQPIEAVEEKESIAIPRSKMRPGKSLYALKVIGDSMVEEGIYDGDIVLVMHQNTATNGQKIVALIDNTCATLKKYYAENDQIRLQPANKKLEPIIIRSDRDFTIQGVVLDVIRTPQVNEGVMISFK